MPIFEISPRLSIHYLEHNPSGNPTTLLLHGLGATGNSWRFQFPPLIEAGYHVLAPDIRGFGKSTYPGGGTSVAELAGDMATLLAWKNVESAHIVGISMGGTLAQQLALDHSSIVDKLVLVNTFANLNPDSINGYLYFAFRLLMVHTLGLPTQARAVTKRIFPHPEQEEMRKILYDQIIQADPSGYRATMRALARFNSLDRLREIDAPTLIITGDADTTVLPKNQLSLLESIPNARQSIIPGAGHAVIVEQPDVFNELLLDFILN